MERLYLSIFIGGPPDPAGGDRVLVRGQYRILLPVHPHINPTLNKMKTMDGLLVSNYDKSVIKLMPKGTDPTAQVCSGRYLYVTELIIMCFVLLRASLFLLCIHTQSLLKLIVSM